MYRTATQLRRSFAPYRKTKKHKSQKCSKHSTELEVSYGKLHLQLRSRHIRWAMQRSIMEAMNAHHNDCKTLCAKATVVETVNSITVIVAEWRCFISRALQEGEVRAESSVAPGFLKDRISLPFTSALKRCSTIERE